MYQHIKRTEEQMRSDFEATMLGFAVQRDESRQIKADLKDMCEAMELQRKALERQGYAIERIGDSLDRQGEALESQRRAMESVQKNVGELFSLVGEYYSDHERRIQTLEGRPPTA